MQWLADGAEQGLLLLAPAAQCRAASHPQPACLAPHVFGCLRCRVNACHLPLPQPYTMAVVEEQLKKAYRTVTEGKFRSVQGSSALALASHLRLGGWWR